MGDERKEGKRKREEEEGRKRVQKLSPLFQAAMASQGLIQSPVTTHQWLPLASSVYVCLAH